MEKSIEEASIFSQDTSSQSIDLNKSFGEYVEPESGSFEIATQLLDPDTEQVEQYSSEINEELFPDKLCDIDLALENLAGNINKTLTDVTEFCKQFQDIEELFCGEKTEKSFSMDNQSACLVESLYHNALVTFNANNKGETKSDNYEFKADNELPAVLKASNEVDEQETELDNLQNTINIFRKMLYDCKKLSLENKKKNPTDTEEMISEIRSESSPCTSSVSSSDFLFGVLENAVATSSPISITGKSDDNDIKTPERRY